ncbi:MAG: hypothetical protein HC836_40455 [Richelia sp. RM2_1_2]|nr:hypothetical protein [Richelia sp. RM2_1_2]
MKNINVLIDSFIKIQDNGVVDFVNLPKLLELLMTKSTVDIVFQVDHHYMYGREFLAYLIVHCIEVANVDFNKVKEWSEDDWKKSLLALTDSNLSFWNMIEPDLTKSAFLQPALEDSTTKCKDPKTYHYAAEIDIPITGKEHFVKPEKGEDYLLWFWTLISAQMGSFYGGRGNYGTFRMNSGLGSRVFLVRDVGFHLSENIQRDVSVILDDFNDKDYKPFNLKGKRLLWIYPYLDNTPQYIVNDIHPLVIEVCRRIRLKLDSNNIIADFYTSENTCIDRSFSDAFKSGIVRCPYMPLQKDSKTGLPVKTYSVGVGAFDLAKIEQIFNTNGTSHQLLGRSQKPKTNLVSVMMLELEQGKSGAYKHYTFIDRSDDSDSLGDKLKIAEERKREHVESLRKDINQIIRLERPGLHKNDRSALQSVAQTELTTYLDDFILNTPGLLEDIANLFPVASYMLDSKDAGYPIYQKIKSFKIDLLAKVFSKITEKKGLTLSEICAILSFIK